MFKVGQKVVCVDDGPSLIGLPCSAVKGEVYTVSGNGIGPYSKLPTVTLVEVAPNPLSNGTFRASRFRPVQETGMEMLRAILIHPKSPVKEEA